MPRFSWPKFPTPPDDPKRAPRREIIWPRAIPLCAAMLVGLLAVEQFISPNFVGNPLIGPGSIGLSLIFGLGGALLIARFGTREPVKPVKGPGMSKTQRRKLERARQLAEQPDVEEEEADEPAVAATSRAGAARPRNRRRRR
jgi:hypothetical protein